MWCASVLDKLRVRVFPSQRSKSLCYVKLKFRAQVWHGLPKLQLCMAPSLFAGVGVVSATEDAVLEAFNRATGALPNDPSKEAYSRSPDFDN